MRKPQTEYRREYDLARYHRIRAEVIEKLGGRCVTCSSVEDLQIDHIDPDEKSFDIAKSYSAAKEKFWKEVAKCQLLCRSCHKSKTSKEQRIDVHGTWGMYRNRKCRCPTCRAFVAAYHAGRKSV